MSRHAKGKRYDTTGKLNIKKVIAVIIAIAVFIMVIVGIKTLLESDTTKITEQTSYYPVYTNDKWGVINQKGEIIITPQYDEMITIPNSKIDMFICVYDVNYENNTYKTKIINSKNEEKFTEYDLIESIENIDKNNLMWYEEDVLKVKKGDLYGLIDYSGKLILPIEYSNIEALSGVKNSIIIRKNDKVGLCDNKGNIIIAPEYKEIRNIQEDYKNGYIVINNDNLYGLIDFTKNIILEPKYEEIKPIASSTIFVVKEQGILKAINKDEETLIENKFDDVKEINTDSLIFIKNGKYGIINTKQEEKVPAEYDDLKYAFGDYYIAKKGDKYGIINLSNETLLSFDYSKITYRKDAGFIEAEKVDSINTQILDNKLEKKLEGIVIDVNAVKGYIRVRIADEYKYYNLKFEEIKATDVLANTIFLDKKDGKYGFIDKEGKVVIDYIYEDGLEQNSYGYAAVKQDGKWTYVDSTGKIGTEKYELKNNIIIDFIGKWHLAEDLNSYYYTDAE